jgi:hypothetical protein
MAAGLAKIGKRDGLAALHVRLKAMQKHHA